MTTQNGPSPTGDSRPLALSRLLRYKVSDTSNHLFRLVDFSIDISDSTYPSVQAVLWRDGERNLQRTTWDQVTEIDHKRRLVRLADDADSQPPEDDWLARAVLLKRDILDALVLNLQGRTTMMANDLVVVDEDKQLILKGVDNGLRAVFRRLSGGRVAGKIHKGFSDWKYIEFLRGDLEAAQQGLDYHDLVGRLPAGEVAYLADTLPYPYAAELLSCLDDTLAADVLEMMIPELQLLAFEELDEEKANRMLQLMRPDIVTDLLSKMDENQVRHWLEHLPKAQSERVLSLLAFPKDTAGGLMTNDIITLACDLTVKEAIDVLTERLKLPDFINFIQLVYVIDNENSQKLQGMVTLRDLLVAEKDRRLEEVMNPYVITLLPDQIAKYAARRVIESGLNALPVLDQDGKILGVVTVDSALDLTLSSNRRKESLRIYS